MALYQTTLPIPERLTRARRLIGEGQYAQARSFLPPLDQAGPTARRLWMRTTIGQEGIGAAIDWLADHGRDATGMIEAGPCEALLNTIATQATVQSSPDELRDTLAALDRLIAQPLAPAQRQRAELIMANLSDNAWQNVTSTTAQAGARPRGMNRENPASSRAIPVVGRIAGKGKRLLNRIRTMIRPASGKAVALPPPTGTAGDIANANMLLSRLASSAALAEWLTATDDQPPPPHDRRLLAAILPSLLGIIGPEQIRRLFDHGLADGLPRLLLRQLALAIAHHPDLEPDDAADLLWRFPQTAEPVQRTAFVRLVQRSRDMTNHLERVRAGLARFPDAEPLWQRLFSHALRSDDQAEITALIRDMTAVTEGVAADDPTGWRARALLLAEHHDAVIDLLEAGKGPAHALAGANALIWARAVLAQGDLPRITAADSVARRGSLGPAGKRIMAILDGIDALAIDGAGRGDLQTLPDDLFGPIIDRAPSPYTPAPDAPVLVVTSSLGAGGAERQTTTTVNTLDGFDRRRMILVASSLDPASKCDFFLPHLRRHGRKVIDLSRIDTADTSDDGFEQAVLSLMPPDIARFAGGLGQQIRKHRPALIHSWQDTTNIAAAIAALITGCPAVIMAGRSLRPKNYARARPYFCAAYRSFLADCPRFRMINNSRAGADDYADWLSVAPEQIGVIENGYPLDEMRARTDADARQRMRHEWGIPEDAPVMGGVMRLSSVKCPERFVGTAILLCRQFPDFHAVLAGGGVLEGKLAAMIADAGLGGRIHLIGRVSPIEPVMAAFDILFLSSRVEGLPNVIIEAQALGIPVAATDVGGVAEALAPAPLGLLLPEDPPELLAPRIAAFMQERRAEPGTARQLAAFVDARFSVAAMAEKTRSAYRQAMAETARRD